MEKKQLFDKYYSRMTMEGIVKSLVCGIIAGLGLAFVIGLIAYFIGADPLWLSLGVGVGTIIATTLVLFFTIFRPTEKKTAERIDRLGLEERLITMLELEDDDSYIAKRQREDAKENLSKVKRDSIKITISSTVIALIAVLAVFASFTTTISTLSARGMMDYLPGMGGGSGIGTGEIYKVEYKVATITDEGELQPDEGGFIEGSSIQFILYDDNAETVIAVADEGMFFVFWLEDESPDPERTDKRIQGNTTYTAVFYAMEGEGGGEGEPGDGESGEPEEESEPSEPGGEGEGSEEEEEGDEDGGGAGGQYDPNYYVIDGETYYKEVIQQFYDEAMAIIEAGGELSPEQLALLEIYREILK